MKANLDEEVTEMASQELLHVWALRKGSSLDLSLMASESGEELN